MKKVRLYYRKNGLYNSPASPFRMDCVTESPAKTEKLERIER